MGKQNIQLKAIIKGIATLQERKKLESQRDVLQNSGLNKEAKSIQKVINKLNVEIRDCETEAEQQRLELVKLMFACFAAGDIATIVADMMADGFDRLTFGRTQDSGVNFVDVFKNQAEEWNKCVQLVDSGQDENFGLSMFYSDMAEEITDAVIPMIRRIVDKYVDSKEGQKYL